MKTHHKIIFGHCTDIVFSEIEESSVHLIVTSPPYWNRKNYGGGSQEIGYNQSYEEYLMSIEVLIKVLKGVLIPGRKMCLVVGDLYMDAKTHGCFSVLPLSADVIRIAKKQGLDYHGAIIWQKVCKTRPSGGVHGCFMGSYPMPVNGIITLDYEYILIFKLPGPSPKVPREIKQQSSLSKEEWQSYFTGHWKIRGTRNDDHPASYPLEIPSRLIKMYSFIGETILDPFLGSGTSILAARRLLRNSIGIELNKGAYWPVIQKKVGFYQKSLANDHEFTMEEYL